MPISICLFVSVCVLLYYVCHVDSSNSSRLRFYLTREARDALCPFVGTEGMTCFDGSKPKSSGKFFSINYLKLPVGVGISVDRSNGRLKAPAVHLTYAPKGSRLWTDGFTGDMFDTFNEVMLAPATQVVAAYDRDSILTFQNASQLDAVWRKTFGKGQIRGGELATPVDILKYYNE